MKIAIAQMSATVGDLAGNVQRLLAQVGAAEAAGARLLLTPELSLTGYSPEDLLLRADFMRDCEAALAELAAQTGEMGVVVGHPARIDGERYNCASLLRRGRVEATYRKQCLPNHSVFDEKRYFKTGDAPLVVDIDGLRVGLIVCADVWEAAPAKAAADAGAQLLAVINASPFHADKIAQRHDVARARVAETGIGVLYANLTGGQDELVFDGASFAMNRAGEVVAQFPAFDDALGTVEIAGADPVGGPFTPLPDLEAAVWRAMVRGVRDYVNNNGFPGVLLGLSGGIDSAVTLAVAVDALGAGRVRAVMMPSRYTADISVDDSREMVKTLGVAYEEIDIWPVYEAFTGQLAASLAGRDADATEENLQARIRGTMLMALSNKRGDLVLTTSNKSETAVGYATLYGDMAGGFGVLKDVPKTLVWRLARWRNTVSPAIPERIITRPPSAELRPDQTDQDSLPPYEVLDAIIEAYVEYDLSPEEILAMGYARADIQRAVRLIDRNEYKRRQAAPGVRITPRAFGRDRRYPITSRYRTLRVWD